MEDSADEDEEGSPSEEDGMNPNQNSRHINRNYSNRGNGLSHQPDFNNVWLPSIIKLNIDHLYMKVSDRLME